MTEATTQATTQAATTQAATDQAATEAARHIDPQADALDELSEKLAAFNALRKSDTAAADAILDQLGGHGPVEQDIIRDLSLPRPLYVPSRFDDAHRLVMKSIEVLKRNGARPVQLNGRLGPLRGLAELVAHFFTAMIVQRHVNRLVNNLDQLYTRRNAWAVKGSPESLLLARARGQVRSTSPAYKSGGGGLPSFLLGGAVLSSALSALKSAVGTIQKQPILVVVTTLALLVLLLGGAWCVLRGAAIARKRIRLTTERPIQALYQTIGAAGNPPGDNALQFALYSLIAMAVAWVLVPAGLYFVFFN